MLTTICLPSLSFSLSSVPHLGLSLSFLCFSFRLPLPRSQPELTVENLPPYLALGRPLLLLFVGEEEDEQGRRESAGALEEMRALLETGQLASHLPAWIHLYVLQPSSASFTQVLYHHSVRFHTVRWMEASGHGDPDIHSLKHTHTHTHTPVRTVIQFRLCSEDETTLGFLEG